jgi:hypothetical protein
MLGFAIFAQLLDMTTTIYGLSIGGYERNRFLGAYPEYTTVIGLKLLLIAVILCGYWITRGHHRWFFNLPISVGTLWTFSIAMVNLSQEVI